MGTPACVMKLNISWPETGAQKSIDIDDDKKLLPFFDKRVSQIVGLDSLGDEFAGFQAQITGGNDKQGFPMMQGVLTPDRVRLLLRKGSKCYRQRRTGEMKRKSVRGCIVSQELSVLNLVLVKKGPAEIPGLTDSEKPLRLGPKRATKIRKLFDLTPEDDVRKFVVRRQVTTKGEKIQGPQDPASRHIHPAPEEAPPCRPQACSRREEQEGAGLVPCPRRPACQGGQGPSC